MLTDQLNEMLLDLEQKASLITCDLDYQKLEQASKIVAAYEEATRAIRYIETAGPKQQALAQTFWDTVNDKKGIHAYCLVGANRSGKSITAASLFVQYILKYGQDGDITYVISPTEDKSKTASGGQAMIHHLIPLKYQRNNFTFGAGYTRNILIVSLPDNRGTMQIKFKNERQEVSTFESDKLIGVWYDEASSESHFNSLIPRLSDRLGFMLLSTLSAFWWIKKRLILAGNPNYYHVQLSIYDNEKNLTKAGIDSFEDLPEWEKKVRLHGEFITEQGLVFPGFVERHQIIAPIIPKAWTRWVLIDLVINTQPYSIAP